MKVTLLGGFGEKGRTSVAVEAGATRVVFDVGIKVGASGAEYYPVFPEARTIDAVFISHAHEDHIGALCRLLALGYGGPIHMTAETLEEAPATLRAYGGADEVARFPLPVDRISLFRPGETVTVGALRVTTGRSGHVAGGAWFHVSDGARSVTYAGDVVPDSAVFRMDPLPSADLVVLDASYGADPVSSAERARAIAAWVAAHPGGSLLPTPLSGRSLELLAALPGPVAVHAAMRPALEAQVAAGDMLVAGAAELVGQRLARAVDWHDGDALPPLPLLCDDGMGTAGPSAALIPRARAAGHPILLTGHLPAGSPGAQALAEGAAAWIRMPTHPTLSGNAAIWERAGRPAALGHSCPPDDLAALGRAIPRLMAHWRTGDSFELGEVAACAS
ncbi:MBL fold metallo-hydrolase [Devosia sp.]|uniref:MBL fold metallo-hydrolase n=1 Tax=Devosia sp. TaxID=1871048 RepID=UPI002EE301CB